MAHGNANPDAGDVGARQETLSGNDKPAEHSQPTRNTQAVARGALVVCFPTRRVHAVLICRERDGDGWLAIAGTHGWLCGSILEARDEAHWLARNLNLPIREVLHG
jgi:hypothetical protein